MSARRPWGKPASSAWSASLLAVYTLYKCAGWPCIIYYMAVYTKYIYYIAVYILYGRIYTVRMCYMAVYVPP